MGGCGWWLSGASLLSPAKAVGRRSKHKRLPLRFKVWPEYERLLCSGRVIYTYVCMSVCMCVCVCLLVLSNDGYVGFCGAVVGCMDSGCGLVGCVVFVGVEVRKLDNFRVIVFSESF